MLSALMLGTKPIWNHDPFFDYVDRWMNGDVSGGGSAAGAFMDQMWTLYRDALPPVPAPPANCGGNAGTGGSGGAAGSAGSGGSAGGGGEGGTSSGSAGSGGGSAGSGGGSAGTSGAAGRGGASATDAGTSGSNSGAATPGTESDSGCGCRMHAPLPARAALVALAVLFAALARRSSAQRRARSSAMVSSVRGSVSRNASASREND
jgi:hypothetical protein